MNINKTLTTTAIICVAGMAFGQGRVSIYNGHIESGTTYDAGASGDQYTGSGFIHGIYAQYIHYTGIRIRDISVSGCDLTGVYILSPDSLVKFCTVETVGSVGISAGIVNNCRANTCGSYGIYGTSVNSCQGFSIGGSGISSDGTVSDSYGYTTGTGYGLAANIAVACYTSGGESITHKYNMP